MVIFLQYLYIILFAPVLTELLPDPDDEEVDGDLVEEKGPEVIEDQKSVVMHFLSQLKFGMDLTKVIIIHGLQICI